jgi:hypothetical protein
VQGLQCWFSDLWLRVEIVEGVSDFRIPLGTGSIQEGGSPGNKARAGMAGVTGERKAQSKRKGRVASRQQAPAARPRVESRVIVRSLHMTTPSGELAKQELLDEARANPFRRANRKISKHESGTTIGLGIVKVCERR